MRKAIKVFSLSFILFIVFLNIFFLITYREKIDLNDDLRNTSAYNFIGLSSGLTEYEIRGDPSGIPVVLIHGLTTAMFEWDKQFDYLISNGYRVLRYNQFGRGLSDRPDAIYDRKFYVAQLDELIEIFFNDRVNLIGHSFGGVLTAEYGVLNPNKVDKLIFIAPALNLEKCNRGIPLVQVPVIGDYCVLTILSPIIASRADKLFRISPDKVYEKFNAQFDLQTRIKGFTSAIKSQLRHDAVSDYSKRFSQLDGSKALLMWGTLDAYVPWYYIKRIEEMNSDIQFIIFDSINHSPNIEIPDIVNEQINSFLKTLP